jgi:hypothetical protein
VAGLLQRTGKHRSEIVVLVIGPVEKLSAARLAMNRYPMSGYRGQFVLGDIPFRQFKPISTVMPGFTIFFTNSVISGSYALRATTWPSMSVSQVEPVAQPGRIGHHRQVRKGITSESPQVAEFRGPHNATAQLSGINGQQGLVFNRVLREIPSPVAAIRDKYL